MDLRHAAYAMIVVNHLAVFSVWSCVRESGLGSAAEVQVKNKHLKRCDLSVRSATFVLLCPLVLWISF